MAIIFIIIQGISYILLAYELVSVDHNIANIISSSAVIFVILVLVNKINHVKKKNATELYVLAFAIFWCIGEILYGLVNYIPESITYPSSADLFYLIGYAFFIIYLYKLNKVYKLKTRIIISFLITISWFIFYFLYVSVNIFHIYEWEGNTFSIVLSFLYPILDIYIAVTALYFFQAKTISLAKEHVSWIFVVIFGMISFIGDFIYGYRMIINIDESFLNLYNLYFNIAYTMIGTSFLIIYKHIIYFPTKYHPT